MGMSSTLRPTVSTNKIKNKRRSSSSRRRGAPPLTGREKGAGFWGTKLSKTKDTNSFRFAFQNIKGLPLAPRSFKAELLTSVFQDYRFDFFGVQEVNCHDRILPPSLRWQRRFPHLHTIAATNRHSTSNRRVIFGGTACFLHENTMLRKIDQGEDPTGLGRWIWVLLQGKQGIRVRVISAYRPVKDTSAKITSVFSQHEHYFNKVAEPLGYREPRLAFFEDLDQQVHKWVAAGDQIVIGMDANEDLNDAPQEWTSKWGLVNIMQSTHPQLPRVATCMSNKKDVPIDGIWTSPGLTVRSAGMTGFGELYAESDHRLLWVDIDVHSLFGFPTPLPDKRPVDSLPLRDPVAMKKYNKYVLEQMEQHKIPAKVFSLEKKALSGEFSVSDVAQYNKLQAIQADIRRRAKRKCRRFYTSAMAFTADVGTVYRRRKLWKLVELRRCNKRVDGRKIRRLMQQLREFDALRISREEANLRAEAAVEAWKNLKKNRDRNREKFEEKLDERRAQATGTTVQSQKRSRQNTAGTRRIFKKIKTVMKPQERMAISTLESTQPDGTIVECLSRLEIEDACVQEGQRRFTQAEHTPFLQGSLLQDFGFNAASVPTQAVLRGDYVPHEDVSHYTRLFIKELKRPDVISALPLITGVASTEEHTKGWKKMRANTGSSPYGPLFCDYIAGTHHSEVADVDASMASIPFMTGFTPTQWREATDVMIPKKKSSRHVQKLRIIVLFDAMFNMGNKRIARDMIRRAGQLGLLPAEAYGGVPGRRATTCTLNKILSLDIIRQERRIAALCSNDARSCYDRIIHTIASICMQRMGVSAEACHVIFGTLQELQHHVRTAFGERARGYGAVRIPLHGVGQGNGAGPAIWLVITIPLISMLRRAGFGLRVFTPLTKEECLLSCFVYVDDADSIHAPLADPTLTVGRVSADMQRMLDLWSGGLHATGGMIEGEKSYWYLIDFKWNSRTLEWEYKSIAETPSTVYLRNPGQLPQPLARKESWEPDPDGTLGTFIAMDGNQRAILDSLRTKVDLWADKIRTGQLTPTEGWLSFKTGLLASLRYQLSTSNLTRKECRTITVKLKHAALQASKLPLTLPDAVVYAPRSYLGVGVPEIWHDQAYLFIEHCLRHGSLSDDPTGVLLRSVIQSMRLEMGVQKCPLQYPHSRWFRCVTKNQFFAMWEYASCASLELRDGLPDLEVGRDNDVFLMEAFEHHGYSPVELKQLNLCRLYLRVYLLSDLTTGTGTHLDETLATGRRPLLTHARLRWPKSGTPSAHCWRLWESALVRCFVGDHDQYPWKLRVQLGDWIAPALYGSAFYSVSRDCIYCPDVIGRFQQFRRAGRVGATRQPTFQRFTTCSELPGDAIPTTTKGSLTAIRHTGIVTHRPCPPTLPDEWWAILTDDSLPLQDLLDAILSGTAIVLTDGSLKDEFGTAAFAFKSSIEDPRRLAFVHMTPGLPHSMTPYRAELGGLYGVAAFLDRLQQHPSFPSNGSITIACDCKEALTHTFLDRPPAPKFADMDLLWEIFLFKRSSRITWRDHWVKGHQDNHVAYVDLDAWGRLNVDMDSMAKDHWRLLQNHRPAPFSLEPSPGVWSLWHQGNRVSQWTTGVAERYYFNPMAEHYWTTKYTNLEVLDFPAVRAAYQSLSLYYQLRIPKVLCRRLPVGSVISSWSPSNSSACPRCGAPDETHRHVLCCQHTGASSLVNKWLDQLELWLVKQSTHPTLRRGVVTLLRSSFRGMPWVPPDTNIDSIRTTFLRQSQFGSSSVLFGWWTNGWAEAQHAYYLSLQRRTTGKRWLTRLITKQWEIAWDLWKHRMEIAKTPDSFSLAHENALLDAVVTADYHRLHDSHPPQLDRWFRFTLQNLLNFPLSYKQEWLDMVRSFDPPPQAPDA